MSPSNFILFCIGLIIASIGFSIFKSPSNFKKIMDDFVKSPAFIYIGAWLAFILGLLILVVVGVTWRSFSNNFIVSIFAYLALIKALSLILFPSEIMGFSKKMIKQFEKLLSKAGLGIMGLGVLLVLVSFF